MNIAWWHRLSAPAAQDAGLIFPWLYRNIAKPTAMTGLSAPTGAPPDKPAGSYKARSVSLIRFPGELPPAPSDRQPGSAACHW